jgi:hypothetical protein
MAGEYSNLSDEELRDKLKLNEASDFYRWAKAELTFRQLKAQNEATRAQREAIEVQRKAAEAGVRSAEAAERNHRYMLWTVIFAAISAVASAVATVWTVMYPG